MNCKTPNTRFSLFNELDRGLNHLMNEVLHSDSGSERVPPLSVYEFEENYVVECDLPGVTLEDITLQIDDGVLNISGSRHSPLANDGTVKVDERSFNDFSRKLHLSKDINPDGIDAELGNGVLKVTIPKSASVVPRQVNIRRSETKS